MPSLPTVAPSAAEPSSIGTSIALTPLRGKKTWRMGCSGEASTCLASSLTTSKCGARRQYSSTGSAARRRFFSLVVRLMGIGRQCSISGCRGNVAVVVIIASMLSPLHAVYVPRVADPCVGL